MAPGRAVTGSRVPASQARASRFALQGLSALGGVAAAWLVTSVAGGKELPWGRPAAPAGYRVVREKGHTVYAPSAAAAREGTAEIALAARRFRTSFGVEPREVVVFLADAPGDFRHVNLAGLRRSGTGFVPFLTRRFLAGDARGAASARFLADAGTLAHEACHSFTAGYAERLRAGGPVPRGYGAGPLPDWFDEMAATLCETPASRGRRRAFLREHLGERIPLAELARMEHPMTVERLARAIAADAGADPSSPVQVLGGEQLEIALGGTRADLFYAQSHSLGEFILARGGPMAMRELATALASGASLEDALATASRAAPALPSTVAALEREWARWVAHGGS